MGHIELKNTNMGSNANACTHETYASHLQFVSLHLIFQLIIAEQLSVIAIKQKQYEQWQKLLAVQIIM